MAVGIKKPTLPLAKLETSRHGQTEVRQTALLTIRDRVSEVCVEMNDAERVEHRNGLEQLRQHFLDSVLMIGQPGHHLVRHMFQDDPDLL